MYVVQLWNVRGRKLAFRCLIILNFRVAMTLDSPGGLFSS